MLDDNPVDEPTTDTTETTGTPARKSSAKRTPAKKAVAKKTTTRKSAATKVTTAPDAGPEAVPEAGPEAGPVPDESAVTEPPAKKAARKTAAKKTAAKKAPARKKATPAGQAPELAPDAAVAQAPAVAVADESAAPMLLFKAPAPTVTRRTRKSAQAPVVETPPEDEDDETVVAGDDAQDEPRKTSAKTSQTRKRGGGNRATEPQESTPPAGQDDGDDTDDGDDDGESGGARRRRRRGGRRRRKSGDGDSGESANEQDSRQDDRQQDKRQPAKPDGRQQENRGGNDAEADSDEDDGDGDGEATSRRRRRRRRAGDDGPEGSDDPQNTVTRVRKKRSAEDEITSISGSTRLEAKKQRRRDGREAGRRRAPIVSEAEFLARREAVERVMVIRQREDLTQIAVLEDKVLVEHYVARESQISIIGNVYLGRVQNVLPSMEAAFVDIGRGRNAVLYAGEVNWSSLGHRDGQPRKIESVLSSGQSILVQVTKDPIGHKGARLSSQVSLAGRFLVYVPDGTTSGISRKLPDTERNRLKALLKEIVPDTAGVIVRTAAEGASEAELTRDVERLKARWEDIEAKLKGSSPQLLYGEPDLTLKVVRDLFTEDFTKLVIEGDDAWDTVQGYVQHVAPDLEERLERYDRGANNGKDSFGAYRIDEQIAKGLDRKVWLPSGGSLVIDRTEAMTVVDVNTGKFTGSGGNLEETVTKNNLEAAEEMVRQLRLRDIGGIIVIDFIDMVLESNRDLVLRRLVECLGRDRTRHQVAEVTSLGLVQMTRKRIGTGLVEAFSENCSHCQGRGVVISDTPVDPAKAEDDSRRGGAPAGGRRSRGGRSRGQDNDLEQGANGDDHARHDGGGRSAVPSPTYVAAVAKPENANQAAIDEVDQPGEVEIEVVEPTPPIDEAESTRPSRGSRSRRRNAPVDEPVLLASESIEERIDEPVAEAEPAVVPEQAVVVTRSRRRSASRPTTTVVTSAPPTISPEATSPVEVPVEAPAEMPAEVAAEATEAPVAPEPPRVVTRTRGRSATRPAGPPVASGAVDPGEGSDTHADNHAVEHVPVKKKGSRKR